MIEIVKAIKTCELKQLNRSGRTIIMVTHDSGAASFGTRIIKLRDGSLSEDIAIGGSPA